MALPSDRADPKHWFLGGLLAGVIVQAAKLATAGKIDEALVTQSIGTVIGFGVVGFVAALIRNRFL